MPSRRGKGRKRKAKTSNASESSSRSAAMPSLDEQLKQVQEAQSAPLEAGQYNYVVDFKWWSLFREHVGLVDTKGPSQAQAPPAIDNSGLLEEAPNQDDDSSEAPPSDNPPECKWSAEAPPSSHRKQLDSLYRWYQQRFATQPLGNDVPDAQFRSTRMKREKHLQGYHYEVLAEEAWKKLQQWYGGGPAIPRRVIELKTGLHHDRTVSSVEVYPVSLLVCTCGADGRINTRHQRTMDFSKQRRASEVRDVIASLLHIPRALVRLWYALPSDDDFIQLTEEDYGNTLYELQFDSDVQLAVEIGVAVPIGLAEALGLPRDAIPQSATPPATRGSSSGSRNSGGVGTNSFEFLNSVDSIFGAASERPRGRRRYGRQSKRKPQTDAAKPLRTRSSALSVGAVSKQSTKRRGRARFATAKRKRKKGTANDENTPETNGTNVDGDVTMSAAKAETNVGPGWHVDSQGKFVLNPGWVIRWPRCTSAFVQQAAVVVDEQTNSDSKKLRVVGARGLRNLGNTCFMNSALQCLSNTALLTNYFLRNHYVQDLNRTNPLGMGGHLAQAYGALIKELWTPENSKMKNAVVPHDLKWAIGRFAHQFMGYRQHDSQELIAFLLDGMHEDLNRILNKPYTPRPDMKDVPDDRQAAMEWALYRKRNDSVIVDLFQGQFRSTVQCPNPKCRQISKTFDPFMYLSLPLPTPSLHVVVSVVVHRRVGYSIAPSSLSDAEAASAVDLDGLIGQTRWRERARFAACPVRFAVRVKKNAKVKDLVRELCATVNSSNFALKNRRPTVSPSTPSGDLGGGVRWLVDSLATAALADLCAQTCWLVQLADDLRVHRVPVPTQSVRMLLRSMQTAGDAITLHAFEVLPRLNHEVAYRQAPGAGSGTGSPFLKPKSRRVTVQPNRSHLKRSPSRRLELGRAASGASAAASRSLRSANSSAAVTSTSLLGSMRGRDLVHRAASSSSATSNNSSSTVENTHNSSGVAAVRLVLLQRRPVNNTSSSDSVLVERPVVMSVLCRVHTNARGHERPVLSARTLYELAHSQVGHLLARSSTSSKRQRRPSSAVGGNEHPFVLRHASGTGSGCGLCAGGKCDSRGCVIVDTSAAGPSPHVQLQLDSSSEGKAAERTFYLDWTEESWAHIDHREARRVEVHSSAAEANPQEELGAEKSVPLAKCFEQFTRAEVLSRDDPYYCSSCKQFLQASKRLELWTVPKVLIVHLKRFRYTRNIRQKLTTAVRYPLKGLDISSWVAPFKTQRSGSSDDGHTNATLSPAQRRVLTEPLAQLRTDFAPDTTGDSPADSDSAEVKQGDVPEVPVAVTPRRSSRLRDRFSPFQGFLTGSALTVPPPTQSSAGASEAVSSTSNAHSDMDVDADKGQDEDDDDEPACPESITPTPDQHCVYDLFAVSYHSSGVMGGGHYTAHALNCVDGQWYEYDDSSVRQVTTDQVRAGRSKGVDSHGSGNSCSSTSAYVLFYARRDTPSADED